MIDFINKASMINHILFLCKISYKKSLVCFILFYFFKRNLYFEKILINLYTLFVIKERRRKMKDVKLDDFDLDIIGDDNNNEDDDGVSPASSISTGWISITIWISNSTSTNFTESKC